MALRTTWTLSAASAGSAWARIEAFPAYDRTDVTNPSPGFAATARSGQGVGL
jgi:hypothetical protein